MKKISILLLAAASIFAVASCERAELQESVPVSVSEEVTLLTLEFDATKTALIDGKTSWVAGDKIRIYSEAGTSYQDVEISSEDAGKASVHVEVNMKSNKYYAVYPVESANGITDGKVSVVIPTKPDGLFASANICVAEVSEGTTLSFKNVTSILKVNIASSNVVEILQIKAKNAMNGTFTVDYEDGVPALTATSQSRSATVAIGGVDGDYYVPVAPGTYTSEFAITALRGNGGYQTVASSRDNELVVNTIYSLGTIGNDLKGGLPGEGTADAPYTISNDGEFGAFVASVNMGNPYEGRYVSLLADIEEPATTPIGHYYAADDQAAFAGNFLGNNHSITLDLDGANLEAQTYVALFGVVDGGASIKDLNVKGTVKATGNYTAGLIAYVRGSADNRVSLENLKSEAAITSTGTRVAGIAAYSSYADLKNCVNGAAVSGTNCVGGIVGYGYFTDIEDCNNNSGITSVAESGTGIVIPYYQYYSTDGLNNNASGTWTNGTGGIAGYAQNSTIKNSNNSAAIAAFHKLGGIVGVAYWTNVESSNNSGTITARGQVNVRADSQFGCQWGSIAGGIAGWVHVQGVVSDCVNNGVITGFGGLGGVVSLACCGNNSISAVLIRNCVNNADITGSNAYSGGTSCAANVGAGGICAAANTYTYWNGSSYDDRNVTIENCTNKGNVTVSNSSNSADAVGGIVGNCYNCNRQNGTSVSVNGGTNIFNCVNEGDITGDFYVGGLVGLNGSRYGQIPVIRNSANHGTVLSTGFSSKYNGILIGGLVGGNMAYNTSFRSRVQVYIYNSYNDGDVLYTNADYATPYVGGAIGSTWGSAAIQNVYVNCKVGIKSGEKPSDAALACLGAIAGYQNASTLNFCYYPKDLLDGRAVGGGTAANTETVTGFDADLNLNQPVTVNYIDCITLLQALNEWVNYYSSVPYLKWTASDGGFPAFAGN